MDLSSSTSETFLHPSLKDLMTDYCRGPAPLYWNNETYVTYSGSFCASPQCKSSQPLSALVPMNLSADRVDSLGIVSDPRPGSKKQDD